MCKLICFVVDFWNTLSKQKPLESHYVYIRLLWICESLEMSRWMTRMRHISYPKQKNTGNKSRNSQGRAVAHMHISFHRPHLKRVENLNASDEDHLVCSTKSYQRNARVFSLFRLHHRPAQYSVPTGFQIDVCKCYTCGWWAALTLENCNKVGIWNSSDNMGIKKITPPSKKIL